MKPDEIPNNADGDVIRRLIKSNFDFSSKHTVDFNIDLENWPPNDQLIKLLKQNSYKYTLHKSSEDFNGYIEIQIKEYITYEFVTKTQDELTKISKPYGGVCESWGIMQN